jgi:predicted dehydrogenase
MVLGTGSIGMRHLNLLTSMEDVQVTAVPTRPGRAAELRAQGIDARESIEEALALAPVGAVVATDTGRHVRDGLKCVSICHLLVEKPIAATLATARELLAAADSQGQRVHVACCLRFDESLAWVKAQLPKLGSIHSADAECLSWLPTWRSGRDHRDSYAARPGEGGVLLDLTHEIDYCLWLFGPVREVAADLENRGITGLPAEIEESARLELIHRSGLRVTLRLSYAIRPPSRRLRIWGELGSLEWDGLARRSRLLDTSGRELARHESRDPNDMYQKQTLAWVDFLRGSVAERLVDGEVGAQAVAVCDASRRSAASRGWVTLG